MQTDEPRGDLDAEATAEATTEASPTPAHAFPVLAALAAVAVVGMVLLPNFVSRWFEPDPGAWVIGLVAGVPMLLAFYLSGELNDLIATTTAVLTGRLPVAVFMLLAALFAVVEEIVFRGIVTDGLQRLGLSPIGSIVLAAAIAAAGYAVNRAAFVLAFLVSLYLAALTVGGESTNLVRPIVAHAFFNIVAAVAILRMAPSAESTDGDSAGIGIGAGTTAPA